MGLQHLMMCPQMFQRKNDVINHAAPMNHTFTAPVPVKSLDSCRHDFTPVSVPVSVQPLNPCGHWIKFDRSKITQRFVWFVRGRHQCQIFGTKFEVFVCRGYDSTSRWLDRVTNTIPGGRYADDGADKVKVRFIQSHPNQITDTKLNCVVVDVVMFRRPITSRWYWWWLRRCFKIGCFKIGCF